MIMLVILGLGVLLFVAVTLMFKFAIFICDSAKKDDDDYPTW